MDSASILLDDHPVAHSTLLSFAGVARRTALGEVAPTTAALLKSLAVLPALGLRRSRAQYARGADGYPPIRLPLSNATSANRITAARPTGDGRRDLAKHIMSLHRRGINGRTPP